VRTFTFAPAAAGSDVTGTDSTLNSSLASRPGERPAESQGLDGRDLHRSDIDALIGRDYVGLRALIFRRTGDPQIAADLLNDAICTALEKYRDGQIAKPEQITGYVFQVAMNHLRNHRRSVGERPERRADAKLIDTLTDDEPDDLDIDSGIVDKVIRIIRSMESPRDRTVLVRFYLDEEEKDVICRDLQLTPAQFASVLHRARQRLKDLIEAHGLKRSDVFSWLII
jgi:RNA polymerase sigma-70 factor, ECF subfamily